MATLDDLKIVLDSINTNISSQGVVLSSILTSQNAAQAYRERIDQLNRADRSSGAGGSGRGGRGGRGGGGSGGDIGAGIGRGLAGIGMGVAGAGAGIAALGLAMPAFFGGLMAGDEGLGWLSSFGAGFDFENLKAAAVGFTDIIKEMDKESLVVLAGIMGISAVGGTKAAMGLGSMGFAITAFLGGLLAGDALFAGYSALGGGFEFGNMKAALVGFSDMILAIDDKSLGVLAGIMGLSAVTGLIGKDSTGAAKALGSLGLGITGFLGGLLAGDLLFATVDALGGDISFSNIKTVLKGFSESIAALTPEAVTALAAIIGVAGVASITAKGTGLAAATQIATIMGGIGAGISGLMAGLVAGGAGIEWIQKTSGATGAGLVSAFKMFNDSIGELNNEGSITALATILTAGTAIGAIAGTKGIGAGVGIFGVMSGIGAGIAGLMVGLFGGSAAIEWIQKTTGATGSGMISAFKMFNDSIGELNNENAITALVAIIGAGTAIGTLVQSLGIGAGVGIFGVMSGIGAGIAGLMTGLMTGSAAIEGIQALTGADGSGIVSVFKMFNDSILQITPEGVERIKDLVEIGGLDIAGAMTGLAGGLVAFSGANFAGSLLEGGRALISFFTGAESPFEQIRQLYQNADELTKGADALDRLTLALERMGDLNFDGSKINIKRFAEDLAESIPVIESAIMGGTIEKFGFFNDLDFKGLASPEVDYEGAVRNILMLRQALSGVISQGTIDGMTTVGAAGTAEQVPPQIINNYYNTDNRQTVYNIRGGSSSTGIFGVGGSGSDLDMMSLPSGAQ